MIFRQRIRLMCTKNGDLWYNHSLCPKRITMQNVMLHNSTIISPLVWTTIMLWFFDNLDSCNFLHLLMSTFYTHTWAIRWCCIPPNTFDIPIWLAPSTATTSSIRSSNDGETKPYKRGIVVRMIWIKSLLQCLSF